MMGATKMAGGVGLRVVRRVSGAPPGWRLRNFMASRRGMELAKMAAARGLAIAHMESRLVGRVYRVEWASLPIDIAAKLKVLLQAVDNPAWLAELGGPLDLLKAPAHFGGFVTDYGLLSTRLVTNNGVGFIVDAFQNSVELENMKYHGFGTGTTAEAQADSALVTELTTQYATDSTRATGTTEEGATANIYKTVATLSPDSGGTIAITEHGIFSQAATGGGVLLDRSKFDAINLVAGSDSLQATYQLTFTAGG